MAEQEQPFMPGDADYRLLALVMSLATAAWSQLGKIPHPVTNKVEKDLEQAKVSIEFLRMLKEKTEGNLKAKEKELLESTVADLELNYADESGKSSEASKGPEILTPTGASGQGPQIIRP